MNRQEAIIVMRDTNWSRMMVDWSYTDRRRVLDAIMVSLAALRVPEPDPDTGLVPCGCAGTAGAWEQQTMAGVKHYVECGTCEISTADYDTPRDAITAWNTALGWGREA